MAKTIEQIQQRITSKVDSREIINEIADYLEENANPITTTEVAINPNKQTISRNAEDGFCDGFLYAKGKLWASGYGNGPALYTFNDLNDLTDFDVVQIDFNTYGGPLDIIYVEETDKIYVAFDNDFLAMIVVELDPDSLAYTNFLYNEDLEGNQAQSLCSDGTYIYGVAGAPGVDSLLFKI